MPGYRAAAAAFEAAGAELAGVPVDDEGLHRRRAARAPAALLYIDAGTPISDRPHALAGRAHADRRLGTARRAASSSRTIAARISATRAPPPPALAAAAPDCTIHLGTFSQSLGAGLRLGYMVVPPAPGRCGAGGQGVAQQGSPLAGAGGAWRSSSAAAASPSHLAAHARGLSRTARPPADRAARAISARSRSAARPAACICSGTCRPACRTPRLSRRWAPGAGRGLFARFGQRLRSIGGPRCRGAASCWAMPALTPKQIEQGHRAPSDAVDDALDGHRIEFGDLLAWRPSVSRAPCPARRPAGQQTGSTVSPATGSPGAAAAPGRFARDDGDGSQRADASGHRTLQVSDQGPEPAADRRRSGSRPASRSRSTASSRWRARARRSTRRSRNGPRRACSSC